MTYAYTLSDIDAAERAMEEHLLKVAVKAVADVVVLDQIADLNGAGAAYVVLCALIEDIHGLHGALNQAAVADTARRLVREQLAEMEVLPNG